VLPFDDTLHHELVELSDELARNEVGETLADGDIGHSDLDLARRLEIIDT
jgi:hypothetical protein